MGYTNGQTLTLRNCVYKPAALADGETAVACSTIYENSGKDPSTVTCENCYYVLGDLQSPTATQGKQAHSISAGDCVTVAFAGTPTVYNVSGITAYKVNDKYCGFDYNNVHYAGSGDDVSLNLTIGSCSHGGYTASAGTLTGTSNPYTLTMPDADVTIYNVESTCPIPTNLTVNYTTGKTATVSWEGTSSTYNIKINGTVTENVSSPYSLTDLDLATNYSVQVQGACGDDGTSGWTNAVTFLTTPCDTEDLCAITFELHDDYGDGWDGAAIQLKDAETKLVIGTATIDGDSDNANVTIYACTGRAVDFVWVSGDWDRETSYVVKDHVGDVILSGREGDGMITNYMVDCSSTCRRPTNLAVSDIGSRSVTLSWTENGEADTWRICLNGDETNLISANTNPFTLSGLTPSTGYIVKVSPDKCGVAKWCDAITFSTDVACHAPTNVTASNVTTSSATIDWTSYNDDFTLRYAVCPTTTGNYGSGESHTYDFEDNTMQGWTTIDADGDSHTWMMVSDFFGDPDPGHNDSKDYVISHSYYDRQPVSPDNYLVSPQVMLGGSISFYAQAQDEDYPAEHFGIAVSTTGNTNADDFTTIKEWTMDAEGGEGAVEKENRWGHYTVDLSAYEGMMGYVAIRHFGCNDQFILNVDDITIVEGVGSLEWTTVSDKISGLSYTLTGLEQGTTYRVQVRSNCGGDDGSSSWSNVRTFTTLTSSSAPHELKATDITATTAKLNWVGAQSSYNVRYSIVTETTVLNEGFEGGSMPAGWSQTDEWWKITRGTGYSSNDDEDIYQAAATGNYNAGCYAYKPSYSDILITPVMDLSGAESATFSFNFLNTNWDGDVNTLKVYYRVNEGEWHYLYSNGQPTDGWTPVTINLQGLAANYQIGFECVGNYSYGMGIDDVVVTKTGPGTWNETNTNVTSPLYLTSNLSPLTSYFWQVQGINDGTPTAWSQMATFTTLDGIDITLYDSGTEAQGNTTIISDYNGQKVNVTLQGRKLFKDGYWNTLCLPFSLPSSGDEGSGVAANLLDGATLMELDTEKYYDANGSTTNAPADGYHKTGLEGTTLYLNFKDASEIVAGTPYIIKWANGDNLDSPVFTGVTIDANMHDAAFTGGSFKGSYEWKEYTTGNSSILFLGEDNTLYWPQPDLTSTPAKYPSIGAFRAYFELTAGSEARQFVLRFGEEGEVMGIESLTSLTPDPSPIGEGSIYTLSGVKVSAPSVSSASSVLRKGLYIVNGKKVVIK